MDLPPICHQQLAAAVDARLQGLSQILPVYLTNERQVEAMVRQVCQVVRADILPERSS